METPPVLAVVLAGCPHARSLVQLVQASYLVPGHIDYAISQTVMTVDDQ